MTIHLVCADEIAPQAWRNGGGTTRELLCWPHAHLWSARVSVADIVRNGPFSTYPDLERWFAVIEGAGVELVFSHELRRIEPDDEPLHFDGAAAPRCRLISGPTRDLNLMLQRGQGLMCVVAPGLAWRGSFRLRGLFTARPGRWRGEGEERQLGANTLLWSDSGHTDAWHFEPDAPGTRAWWLGFTPRKAS
ncbi:MAG TPA: HutD family protein [Burkholderiaceae bacterium]|nr:HutD family protein [Burkholderiaceae bacterium]